MELLQTTNTHFDLVVTGYEPNTPEKLSKFILIDQSILILVEPLELSPDFKTDSSLQIPTLESRLYEAMSSTVLSSKSGLRPEMAKPEEEDLRPVPPTLAVGSLTTAAAFSKLFLKSISKGEQVRRRPFIEAPNHLASAFVAPWGVNELPSMLEL